MRKILLVLFALPTMLFAQNVGVGTASPTAKLDVDGTVRLRGSLTLDSLKPQTGATWLIINSTGKVDTTSIGAPGPAGPQGVQGPQGVAGTPNTADNGLTITSNNIQLGGTLLQTTSIAQNGFDFLLTSAGSVGIGNLAGGGSPSHKLHVAGATRVEDGFLANDGTAGLPGFRFNGDVDNGMYRAATNSIGFVTGGTERIRILSNGNIGIGTSTPNSTLSFNGGLQGKIRVITTDAAVTLDNTDFFVLSTNTFAANRTMTLPTLTAGTTDGKVLIIRNGGTTTTSGWNLTAAVGNTLSLAGAWANPMYNAEGVILVSRGTVWYMIEF